MQQFPDEFDIYLNSILPKIIDRLGDVKPSIRDNVEKFLWEATTLYGCDKVWPELIGQLQHHNSRNKQQALALIPIARRKYVQDFPLEILLEHMLPSISDANSTLRQTALETFEALYLITGNSLLIWLVAKPDSKQLSALRERLQTLTPKADAIPLKFKSESRIRKPTKTAASAERKPLTTQQQNSQAVPVVDKEGSELILIDIAGSITDKEMKETLGSVSSSLGVKVEWELRVSTLQKIEKVGAAASSSLAQTTLFLSLFRELIPGIMDCATDLRSQVCRAGCSVFANVARALKTNLAPCADEIVTGLLPKLSVAKEVIANSAYLAMRFIILNVGPCQNLTSVLTSTAVENRNHLIRARAIEFFAIQLLIGSVEPGQVTAAISASLRDANNLCRVQGRLALRALFSISAEAAKGIYMALEPNGQKQIDLAAPVTLEDLKSSSVKRLESTAPVKKTSSLPTESKSAIPAPGAKRPSSMKELPPWKRKDNAKSEEVDSVKVAESVEEAKELPPWKRKPAAVEVIPEEKSAETSSELPPWKRKGAVKSQSVDTILEPVNHSRTEETVESLVVESQTEAPVKKELPPWKRKGVAKAAQSDVVIVAEKAEETPSQTQALPPWKQKRLSKPASVDVVVLDSEQKTQVQSGPLVESLSDIPGTKSEETPADRPLPPWKQKRPTRQTSVEVVVLESQTDLQSKPNSAPIETISPPIEATPEIEIAVAIPEEVPAQEVDAETKLEAAISVPEEVEQLVEQAEVAETVTEEPPLAAPVITEQLELAEVAETVTAEEPATETPSQEISESDSFEVIPTQAEIDAILLSVGIGRSSDTPYKSQATAAQSPLRTPAPIADAKENQAQKENQTTPEPNVVTRVAGPSKAKCEPVRANGAEEWSQVQHLVTQPIDASICRTLLGLSYRTMRARRAAEMYLRSAGELLPEELEQLLLNSTWLNGRLIVAEAACSSGFNANV